ncbi:ABC transporter ATP-binding protein [Streptomyces sp. NEAU-H3]|uniref:ABC transporter ATP-binding protein n=1 Tax=Streptomyces sp. NEAU-H3 TaxID=2720636 RepID=UPI0014392D39|nr:ABC transporter ATP-binding protein [Streptomyces sp. NEAU-H3]NJA60251.1 ABC transporter ATP-binding protein [Streptomyces sp. NEAU-H3]
MTPPDKPTDERSPVLDLSGVSVAYGTRTVLHGIDLRLAPGQVLAVLGASGSGKSTLAQAVLGLLPPGGRVTAGRVTVAGHDITALAPHRLRALRGTVTGLVPQDQAVSLDPLVRVGAQVTETLRAHRLVDRREAARRAVPLLGEAGIEAPGPLARAYPHALSGGQRQRVLVAGAFAARPPLVVADEPTSALDATVRRRVMDRFAALVAAHGTAVLLVTHDFRLARERADQVAVLADGRLVESGPAARVLDRPAHPYTRRLMGAGRRVAARGTAPRASGTPVVRARDLVKEYRRDGRRVRAVDGVGFTVREGEFFALVGESGSGKSTTARLVTGLTAPTSGTVEHAPAPVRPQLVQQSPYAAFDPRWTVRRIVEEPLRARHVPGARRRARLRELLALVGLDEELLARRPRELSGGQRQRVALARALAPEPRLLVCDEPVSALDPVARERVVHLLERLRTELGLTCLFVSHELDVVRRLCDRVAVMRDGRLLESGPVGEVLSAPSHPYTRALLAAEAGPSDTPGAE